MVFHQAGSHPPDSRLFSPNPALTILHFIWCLHGAGFFFTAQQAVINTQKSLWMT